MSKGSMWNTDWVDYFGGKTPVKGSKRRPQVVSDKKLCANWDRAFNVYCKKNLPRMVEELKKARLEGKK